MSLFDSVVFAGGGHRCWWQLGWWQVVAEQIDLQPTQVAGVSAGAATACLLYASNAETGLAYYHRVLGPGARNFYPSRLFSSSARALPHEQIYRAALAELLGGSGFDRIMTSAPVIRIMFARPPRWLPPALAVGAGLAAYNIEKYCWQPLHPVFGVRLGFRPEVVTVQSCPDVQSLINLIIASSSTPPFTSVQTIGGRPVLDGGLIDNVPVGALVGPDSTQVTNKPLRTLVLMTRCYKNYDSVFTHDRRVYVQPSTPVPVSSWDYTNASAYQETFDQGRRDAQLFLRWHWRQLAEAI